MNLIWTLGSSEILCLHIACSPEAYRLSPASIRSILLSLTSSSNGFVSVRTMQTKPGSQLTGFPLSNAVAFSDTLKL